MLTGADFNNEFYSSYSDEGLAAAEKAIATERDRRRAAKFAAEQAARIAPGTRVVATVHGFGRVLAQNPKLGPLNFPGNVFIAFDSGVVKEFYPTNYDVVPA